MMNTLLLVLPAVMWLAGAFDNDFGPTYNVAGRLATTTVYSSCKESDRWDTNVYALNCGLTCSLAALDNANGFVAVTGKLNKGQLQKFKAKEANGFFDTSYNWGNGNGHPPSPEKGHKGGKKGKERSAESAEQSTARDSSIFAGPVTVSFFTTSFGFPNFRFARVHADGRGAGTSYGYRLLGYVEYRESSTGPQGLDPSDTIVTRHIFNSDFSGYVWAPLLVVRSPANDFTVPGTYTVTTNFAHPSKGKFLELTVTFSEQLRVGFNGRCLGPERFEHSIRVFNAFTSNDTSIRVAVISTIDHSSRISNYSPNLSFLSAIQILGDADADDFSVGFFAWDRQATCNGNNIDFEAHAWGLTSPYGTAVAANPFTDVDEDHVYFSWSLIGNAQCDNIFWDPSNGVADPSTLEASSSSDGTTAATGPGSPADKNAGAIAGGVVGGVVLLALIALVIVFVARSRRRNRQNAAFGPETGYGGRHGGRGKSFETYTGPYSTTYTNTTYGYSTPSGYTQSQI